MSGDPSMSELRKNWPLVFTSTIGVSVGTIGIYSMGLFIAPLEQAFGWSRTQITSGLLISGLMAVPLSPFVGALIDKWGGRQLALIGSILTGAVFAAFSLIQNSLIQWWMLWALFGLVLLGVKTTVWTAAVARVFEKERGLALAITLSGAGIAATLMPSLAEYCIANFGWRQAYALIGLGWAAPTVALVLFFFFDPRPSAAAPAQAGAPARPVHLPGLNVWEALRSWAFLKICFVTLTLNSLLIGLTIHLVPIFTASGVARETAAAVSGAVGIASIVGKLVSGPLVDRWPGRYVAAFFALPPIIACVLLLQPNIGSVSATIAALSIGLAAGSLMTMASYLTTRYVGMRSYGTNFGIIASLLALSVGLGPMLCGMVYDAQQSYQSVLFGGFGVSIVSTLLFISLGAPPAWNTQTPLEGESRGGADDASDHVQSAP